MIFNKNNKVPIFVIGTGRSGTHLLGRTFKSNSDVHTFIEDPLFFNKVTKLATGIEEGKGAKKEIIELYKKEFKKVNKTFILEKTHPNIWLVEDLLKAFPQAKFIGIERDVFSTVSSMLNHNGVLGWYNILPQNISNKFLGITEENKYVFEGFPLEIKCALRWKSHSERLKYLEEKFRNNVLLIDYSDFYLHNDSLMEKLVRFIGLPSKLKSEELNEGGMYKWKEKLSKEQIDNINSVI